MLFLWAVKEFDDSLISRIFGSFGNRICSRQSTPGQLFQPPFYGAGLVTGRLLRLFILTAAVYPLQDCANFGSPVRIDSVEVRVRGKDAMFVIGESKVFVFNRTAVEKNYFQNYKVYLWDIRKN